MKFLILFLLIPLSIQAMQTVIPQPSKTVDLTNHDVILTVGHSPSGSPTPKPAELDAALRKRLEQDGQHGAFVDEADQIMSLEELKTWVIGVMTQFEQQHALTLQQLQDALDKHAVTTTTAQNTAQKAQNSSKYAVYAAIVTGTASILVCIASSLMSHFL
jgi:hypothetical protein